VSCADGPPGTDNWTPWQAWHDQYDAPGSPLSRRLRIVQRHIRAWLDRSPGDVRVVGVCAGDGRDILGVLASRPDADRVCVTLLELDEHLAAAAEASAGTYNPAHVNVRRADAGLSDNYVGAVPADLVLLCGVLGNVADGDVRRTVEWLPELCAPGATVVWTRSRRAPDLTPQLRRWFAEAGFAEDAFDAPDDVLFSVGVCQLVAEPRPLVAGQRVFTFT
jgi:hypothetical protein